MDLSSKTSDLSSNIGGALKNNLIAFTTLFFGTFIYNLANEKDFKDLFNNEVVYISLSLVIISVIYLIATYIEVSNKLKHHKTLYDRLKENYKDILNKEDIEMIFKNDTYFEEDKAHVYKMRKFYSIVWFLILLVLFILICVLRAEYLVYYCCSSSCYHTKNLLILFIKYR